MTRLAILLAAAALASCASAPTQQPVQAHARVIANKCDRFGGVSSITEVVSGPGTVTLTWDNRDVCGTPS